MKKVSVQVQIPIEEHNPYTHISESAIMVAPKSSETIPSFNSNQLQQMLAAKTIKAM